MRPKHIEEYLMTLHSGQWFGWSDSKNKVYENLILTPTIFDSESNSMVSNPYSKPTEEECTTGLTNLQATWDADNDSYKSNRRDEYPTLAEQLDKLYHDISNGTLDNTGDFYTALKTVKDKYPKE